MNPRLLTNETSIADNCGETHQLVSGTLRRVLPWILLILGICIPLIVTDDYLLYLLTITCIWAVWASSLNIIMGYRGILNLMHPAIVGAAAYASALLMMRLGWPFGLCLVSSAIFSAILALVIGLIIMRMSIDALIIATLGFRLILEVAANNLVNITNGPMGLSRIPAPSLSIFGTTYTMTSDRDFYWLIFAILILTIFVVYRLGNSYFGRALLGLRENSDLAMAMGVNSFRYGVVAMTISGFLGGLAGSFYAHYTTIVAPIILGFSYSSTMTIMVVTGGRGTVIGPLISAVIFTLVPQALRSIPAVREYLYAALMMFTILKMPLGLITLPERFVEWKKGKSKRVSFAQHNHSQVQELATEANNCDSLQLETLCSDSEHLATNERYQQARSLLMSHSSKQSFEQEKLSKQEPLLKIENVGLRFYGLAALQGVSMQVYPHQVQGLIGPNGAGKTSLFNVITGFYKPTSGAIWYQNQKISGLQPHEIAQKGIIRTYQATTVFPNLTVLDNVLIGTHRLQNSGVGAIVANTAHFRDISHALNDRAWAALDFVGIHSKSNNKACNLAYGEQRLLEIAIALASDPVLVLLDEPSAGMNHEESRKLMELIGYIRDLGITVILVEHNMNVVMGICDNIVVLDHGEKIAEGVPKQVQTNPKVIEAYLGSGVYAKRN